MATSPDETPLPSSQGANGLTQVQLSNITKSPCTNCKARLGGCKAHCGELTAKQIGSPVLKPSEAGAGADGLAALAEIGTDSGRETINEILENWDRDAIVRHRPRRVLIPEEEADRFYFKPEFVPHTSHPMVSEFGPKVLRRLLVEHFYTYSDFTEQLEDKSVIAVGIDIANGLTGLTIPDAFVAGARTLNTDETFHSQFTFDLQNQVARATGIFPSRGLVPSYLNGFIEIQQSLTPSLRRLSRLLFAVVSETLITGTLTSIPKDGRVVGAVRQAFDDHATDERRHHVYFAALFREVWPQMNRNQQGILGPLLPRFIRLFLDPDIAAIRRALKTLALNEKSIEQIILESYPAAKIVSDGRASAKATLRLFKETGVLEVTSAKEAFDKLGLIG